MKKLYSYKNGDFYTKIYNDGTKIRYGFGIAEHPENIDIKITNYCDAGCGFCHEMSTTEGEHGDIKKLFPLLTYLPKGVEFAIGGGNPLDHPDLLWFLKSLKEGGYIPNLTVNSIHYKNITQEIRDNVYGLGISYGGGIKFEPEDNIVIHTILGVNTPKQIGELLDRGFKVLILGYKFYGRGESFFTQRIKKGIMNMYREIHGLLGRGLISFDNLAIEQLNLSRLYTKKTRDSKYMGDEGTFTMYIDATTFTYGIASSLPGRYNLTTVPLAFSHIKNEDKKTISVRDK